MKLAAKWVRRYRAGGIADLRDRSSRPRCSPRQTGSALIAQVEQLRRQRCNGWRIARELGLSRTKVSLILRRLGLNRPRSLDPPRPVMRYEHKHPGDLIHFDIKRLARIVKPGHRVTGGPPQTVAGMGYEYLHIAIDDHSRISFAAILPDQKHTSAIHFFLLARAYYARCGFSIRRVLTNNGSCSRTGPFVAFSSASTSNIASPGRGPIPAHRWQGKTFHPNALREWAYARSYQNSSEREQNLDLWLHDYNFHRPHTSLNLNSPASRSGLNRNNLLTLPHLAGKLIMHLSRLKFLPNTRHFRWF